MSFVRKRTGATQFANIFFFNFWENMRDFNFWKNIFLNSEKKYNFVFWKEIFSNSGKKYFCFLEKKILNSEKNNLTAARQLLGVTASPGLARVAGVK